MTRMGEEQCTLRGVAEIAGAGLHSGAPCRLRLKPAAPGAGIVFRRIDLGRPLEESLIPARADFVEETRLGVRLRNRWGVEVATTEHVVAALYLCGVDNALVELDAREAPILDGSAQGYVALIDAAGLVGQGVRRRSLVIDRAFRVGTDERFIEAVPGDARRVALTIDFPDRAIGQSAIAFDLDDAAFTRGRLARARTFCAARDIEAMRAAGFGRGGSLDNAVVVDDARILNPEGLRDPDEFVLHKALDLVGDLALAGVRIIGTITAHRPGHDLNTALAREFLRVSAEQRVF